jgi:hypothetical protein
MPSPNKGVMIHRSMLHSNFKTQMGVVGVVAATARPGERPSDSTQSYKMLRSNNEAFSSLLIGRSNPRFLGDGARRRAARAGFTLDLLS